MLVKHADWILSQLISYEGSLMLYSTNNSTALSIVVTTYLDGFFAFFLAGEGCFWGWSVKFYVAAVVCFGCCGSGADLPR